MDQVLLIFIHNKLEAVKVCLSNTEGLMNKISISILISLMISGCSTIEYRGHKNIEYEGHKYKFVYDQVSWHEAKKLAEQEGGHLAIFETPEEISFIQSSQKQRKTAWVGITDSQVEGEWRWIDGSKLDPTIESFLKRGRDMEARDYGHILLQGGLMSRHKSGILPRGWRGREYVEGYLIEWDTPQKKHIEKIQEIESYADIRCNRNVVSKNTIKTPIIMIQQKYPVKFARKGIEGYVKLEFDISEKGGVKNIRVIEPSPSIFFVQEAKNALSKWVYEPELENNKSIISKCHRVELGFVIKNRAPDFTIQFLN